MLSEESSDRSGVSGINKKSDFLGRAVLDGRSLTVEYFSKTVFRPIVDGKLSASLSQPSRGALRSQRAHRRHERSTRRIRPRDPPSSS